MRVVAIDGPAGSGKGTVCKMVSKLENLVYIDTGAMYRCIAYLILKNNIDITDEDKIVELAKSADIQFVGEKVITSGIGGVFPVGLPVGAIAAIDESGIKIKPANSLSRLEYVMIVDYKLPDPAHELYGENTDAR